MVIKNFDDLARTPQRKIVLELIESALEAIEPQKVLEKNISVENAVLKIQDKIFDLQNFERVFLVGFGKGSAGIAKIVEEKLGDRLTAGYDIDVVQTEFSKIKFTLGTHPLPTEQNLRFTQEVLDGLGQLTEKDLVLVVICGGGSVMFEKPHKINLGTLTMLNKALLRSGATISEMNVIRKHLSDTKGGGLAKALYPATVASLIFSDVPGNDLSVIASGSTVKDQSTLQEALDLLEKYQITKELPLSSDDFTETPKEDKYFEKVSNMMILSNVTALEAMQKKAQELGITAVIHSDKTQGDAKEVGKQLIDLAKPGEILLIGGETTVKVVGNGEGGRNQTLVLAALQYVGENTIIASFDSDGWDFFELAGAIGDSLTVKKAQELGLDTTMFLNNDDSYHFLTQVGDGILTGKLASNVSDLMIVYKW
ncbi:MAG TPA: DUF4147 domain-containing protein [Candidatus Saccharimonadales bacterium]|nr:DUF4147 domain-containing protein [Candidatus Saccharimonadales bacterium]